MIYQGFPRYSQRLKLQIFIVYMIVFMGIFSFGWQIHAAKGR